MELSSFFANICAKNLREEVLLQWEKKITHILCKLEMIFPPSFFDIMVHLVMHLTREALLGGLIHFRWMYPVERYLGKLKSYVKNRYRIEASIAEGYIAEECLDFCSRYLNTTSTIYNIAPRNYRDERPMGRLRGDVYELTRTELIQAHRCILQNCHNKDLENYMRLHEEELRVGLRKRKKSARNLQQLHHLEFHSWLKERVIGELGNGQQVSEFVQKIAYMDRITCRRYKGYFVNGYRFRVEEIDGKKVTQNCGIMHSATTTCFSSVHDQYPIESSIDYYGKLTDVLLVSYRDLDDKFALFKCKWVSNAGIKKDDFGMKLVSFDYLIQSNRISDEPFIFARDAAQVFYVNDDDESTWMLVIGMKPRDLYAMGVDNHEDESAIECDPMNITISDEVGVVHDTDRPQFIAEDAVVVSSDDLNAIICEIDSAPEGNQLQ